MRNSNDQSRDHSILFVFSELAELEKVDSFISISSNFSLEWHECYASQLAPKAPLIPVAFGTCLLAP